MTAPSIVLDEVSKWYGEVLAVNEFSATLGPGVTGLLGPNGAGKSTLLKTIVGMLAPSLGTVRVCGADPFRTPGVMRRVGLVPEQDPAYAGASALEVVSYLTRLHGYSRADARARARTALVDCGLEAALDRPVTTFSKGMRQRVKLAQAVAHRPDVLVLDEPMNGLDPLGRRDVAAVVRRMGDEGACVLVSSHVLHEVEAVARRILAMDHGRVVADGSVSRLRRDLSDRPSIVRVRSPAAREVARRLLALESTGGVALSNGEALVTTTSPEQTFLEIARLSVEERLPVEEFQPTDDDLEAVFRYLTGAR